MDIVFRESGRLWAPRGQPVETDEHGYTVFFSGEWRAFHNTHVKLSNELQEVSDVVVLLGEPGSGKSHELKLLKARALAAASRQVSSLDLGKYADAARLDAALRRELKACINDGVSSILFLDALDESRVNIKCAETVLEDVLRDVSPWALQLVITCRTPAWPDSLEEFLREHWKANGSNESTVSVFEIAPYSREQVLARLLETGIDENCFFEALDGSSAHGLALQPLGLGFLMSQFKDGSTFSTSRWELYERGCAALLKESSTSRLEGGSLLLPNVQSRLQLAGLIATCVLLTNNADIVLDNTGNFAPAGAQCLDIARLLTVPLSSNSGDWYATIEEYAETLQSGLFVAKEDGVFVFAHRTYAEFLAAHFISSLNISAKQVMAVLSLSDGSGRLVPQLRELSAWLGHSSPELLGLVLNAEPAMVFDSSVSLTDETHIATIFDELTALVERHKLPIYDRRQIRTYHKLRHAGLLEKLREILADRKRKATLRQFAADVARMCEMVGNIPELVDISLEASEDYQVRQSAAYAVHATGSQAAKSALRALITSDHPEDSDDELRGIALLSALDAGISVGELIGSITKEKHSNFSGMYALALRQLENADLQAADITPLLSWLEPQLQRQSMDIAWEDFVTHMFSKAALAVMSHDEGWAAFGKVAWLAISNHHRLSTSREQCGFDKGLELEAHTYRRSQLLDSILNVAEGEPCVVAGQLRYGTGLLSDADGQHLIDAYQREAGSGTKKRVIAHLALWYAYDNSDVREWLLTTAGPNAESRDLLLAELASNYVDVVPLDSPKADSLRKTLALRLQHTLPTEPPTEKKPSIDLLSAALVRAENGDTWKWVNILSYLRYEGDFEGYYRVSLEVTTSPLWPKLSTVTQRQLIDVAHAYLHATGPVANLAANQANPYEDAGIAALVLLYSTGHGSTDEFGEIVVKWAQALARCGFSEQPRAAINELLQQAWMRAEDSMILLLSETCEQHLALEITAGLPDFASDFMPDALFRALEALLPQVKSEQGFLALSEFLIEQGSQDAIGKLLERIQSSSDLSAAPASKLLSRLAKHAPSQLIAHVWERLRQCPEAVAQMAAQMQVLVAGQDVPLLRVAPAVTEQIFEILEKQYPSATDDKLGGIVTVRHHIQDFRTCCLINLRNRADADSIEALERISARHPDHPWIASLIYEAEQKLVRDSWLPYEVLEVTAVLGISTGRVIRTEAELHDAVLSELHLIADKVSASALRPAVYFLWDEISQRPKHEPRLCDWLAGELKDRLSHKGAIVNREAQVRSHNPKGMGERTDILVELSSPTRSGKSGRSLSLVIEVKGCWNKELITAPASQLRDNYMKAYGAKSGIYLVMWFMCDRWAKDDFRKRDTQRLIPDGTYEACVDTVAAACCTASVGGATLTPFAIDCTY
ncbi:hypothetical protein QU481_10985 [Crenobacter sp. SG2303]|uniref:ATP-binding protein n=1 Tax=Crenobacter oryzisoli TaxID=3056844 RepID=A0ABT7XNT5_9NEIS|nr:hypothetical protein [Crenobacter sp. SG2303]MDN0075415.1 hypothetical protein [Crenobacter sp. SG2303]